ncbi:hypothetical protein GOODEAATRI_023085 [Goodea atripinnis]|uniref:Uncharacterized protein n=1 Tax=Goodea atripinnis TaxID=208336 RepID=A0ABV0NCX7_9TELE
MTLNRRWHQYAIDVSILPNPKKNTTAEDPKRSTTSSGAAPPTVRIKAASVISLEFLMTASVMLKALMFSTTSRFILTSRNWQRAITSDTTG